MNSQAFTRKQFLAWECSHDEYYNQFITKERINKVRISIWLDSIILNKEVPLQKWGWIFEYDNTGIDKDMRKVWDYATQAWFVCLAKACAKKIKEYHDKFDSIPMEEKVNLVCPY